MQQAKRISDNIAFMYLGELIEYDSSTRLGIQKFEWNSGNMIMIQFPFLDYLYMLLNQLFIAFDICEYPNHFSLTWILFKHIKQNLFKINLMIWKR